MKYNYFDHYFLQASQPNWIPGDISLEEQESVWIGTSSLIFLYSFIVYKTSLLFGYLSLVEDKLWIWLYFEYCDWKMMNKCQDICGFPCALCWLWILWFEVDQSQEFVPFWSSLVISSPQSHLLQSKSASQECHVVEWSQDLPTVQFWQVAVSKQSHVFHPLLSFTVWLRMGMMHFCARV